jgi:hypothetical protein
VRRGRDAAISGAGRGLAAWSARTTEAVAVKCEAFNAGCDHRGKLPTCNYLVAAPFAPELCQFVRPSKSRARGMPGAQCTRSLVCAYVVEYAHEYSQRRHRNHPAFPTQWFTAYSALSPVRRAFWPPSVVGLIENCDLSISVGMPGPHGLAVRIRVVRRRANSALQLRHVHRIPRPTFVTTAKRPSWRARDVSSKHQFRKKRKRNILRGGTGLGKRLEAAGKISFSRMRFSCVERPRRARRWSKSRLIRPSTGRLTSSRSWRRPLRVMAGLACPAKPWRSQVPAIHGFRQASGRVAALIRQPKPGFRE